MYVYMALSLCMCMCMYVSVANANRGGGLEDEGVREPQVRAVQLLHASQVPRRRRGQGRACVCSRSCEYRFEY